MTLSTDKSQEVIAPIIAAVAQSKVLQIGQDMLPALIWATGLTSDDSIPIKLTPDGNATTLVKETAVQDGSAIVLTPTNMMEAIKTPMTIVIDKPVTAAAVGIYLNVGFNR